MNQNAKRNLHRRKRQAMRLARKTYFKKLKQPLDTTAPAGEGAAAPPKR